jgi:hypothetical protein
MDRTHSTTTSLPLSHTPQKRQPSDPNNWLCPCCGRENTSFAPDCPCAPPPEGDPPPLIDGEVVRKAAVRRALAARFPTMRPAIELDGDNFGRPLDWHWPGRRGWGYVYSADTMGVVVTGAQTRAKLRRQSRWEVLQDGDTELTVLVPDRDFRQAAKLVGLRQRRKPTTKQSAALDAARRIASERLRTSPSSDRQAAPPTPPTLGEMVLYLSLGSRQERKKVTIELAEEFGEVEREFGRWFARVWYWKQVLAKIRPGIRGRTGAWSARGVKLLVATGVAAAIREWLSLS